MHPPRRRAGFLGAIAVAVFLDFVAQRVAYTPGSDLAGAGLRPRNLTRSQLGGARVAVGSCQPDERRYADTIRNG